MKPTTIPAEPLSPGRVEGTLTRGAVPPSVGQVLFVTTRDDPRLADGRWGGFVLSGQLPGGQRPARPAVGAVDADLLHEGEWVGLDGERGELWIRGVEVVDVVSAFLVDEGGRVLVVRRSQQVGSFRGAWSGISGFLEEPSALAQALTELREETGVEPGSLGEAREGRRVCARDGDRIYVVHPFAFRVRHPAIRLDWENTEARWVAPSELAQLTTVPKLAVAWGAAAVGRRVSLTAKP